MTKQLLIRAAATTALALSFSGAFASADISNTGFSSKNSVKSTVSSHLTVVNNNVLGLDNTNRQSAYSGKASDSKNTDGDGGAMTGDAGNANSLKITANVDNTGAAGGLGSGSASGPMDLGSIDGTGADSTNTISSTVKNTATVTNNNTVDLQNCNSQSATSGSASVSENTNGGDAQTGDATNSNSTEVTLNFVN